MTAVQPRGDATRDRLLEAAAAVLAERGPSQTTLREIARRAGLSHGAPLRHFATLNELLTEIARDGFVALHHAVGARVAAAGPGAGPRRRLAAAGVAYVGIAVERPRVFELMFRADIVRFEHPELAAAGAAAFAQLRDLGALGAATDEVSLDGQLATLLRALGLPPASLDDPILAPATNPTDIRRNP